MASSRETTLHTVQVISTFVKGLSLALRFPRCFRIHSHLCISFQHFPTSYSGCFPRTFHHAHCHNGIYSPSESDIKFNRRELIFESLINYRRTNFDVLGKIESMQSFARPSKHPVTTNILLGILFYKNKKKKFRFVFVRERVNESKRSSRTNLVALSSFVDKFFVSFLETKVFCMKCANNGTIFAS